MPSDRPAGRSNSGVRFVRIGTSPVVMRKPQMIRPTFIVSGTTPCRWGLDDWLSGMNCPANELLQGELVEAMNVA